MTAETTNNLVIVLRRIFIEAEATLVMTVSSLISRRSGVIIHDKHEVIFQTIDPMDNFTLFNRYFRWFSQAFKPSLLDCIDLS